MKKKMICPALDSKTIKNNIKELENSENGKWKEEFSKLMVSLSKK